MSEKPSSRKRWHELKPGDLVKVLDAPRAYVVGVVIYTYSANVYESSSAEILVDGRREHISTRYLSWIDPNPDISVIS